MALGCTPVAVHPAADAGAASDPGEIDDAGVSDDAGLVADECPEGLFERLDGVAGERVVRELPAGCELELSIWLEAAALVEVTAAGATVSLDGTGEDEAGWIATRVWNAGQHVLQMSALDDEREHAFTLTLASHGPPVDALQIERSLVWTQAALLDDEDTIGLARVLAIVAEDGHGGRLLERWLTRFSTTAHSERAGPTLLLEELRESFGADTSAWDLSALPLRVTGVHNRADLRDDTRCGELRVSLASLHDVWRPLHLIFLFAQPAGEGDISPSGRVHCHATARRWARLSSLDDESFLVAARALLDEGLTRERFLLAESEELTVSPWEWRQWTLVDNPVASEQATLPFVFENVPLFQTVDISAVNAPGPLRESFLTFVAENAASLNERRQLIPAAFRPLSVRVNSGVPWQPLNLDGVGDELLASYPSLRQHIETVGCAGCHMAGEFVQTHEDRSFSSFYDSELLARREHLSSLQAGALDDRPPFGALQASPPLTP